ncbi:MAG: hypothetical protein EG825_00640 [Rhodocyclaceae bacterium]|nr:hypothetical protein [Rhodocyclaceae bacterium]
MSKPRYIVIEASELHSLVTTGRQLLDLIQHGNLVAAEDDIALARCTGVTNLLDAHLADVEGLLIDQSASPFAEHRETLIHGGYSTARRLADLSLHLWNDSNPVALARLFGNADTRHTRMALEIIAAYASEGENDPAFMALGNELRDQRRAEAETNREAA